MPSFFWSVSVKKVKIEQSQLYPYNTNYLRLLKLAKHLKNAKIYKNVKNTTKTNIDIYEFFSDGVSRWAEGGGVLDRPRGFSRGGWPNGCVWSRWGGGSQNFRSSDHVINNIFTNNISKCNERLMKAYVTGLLHGQRDDNKMSFV